MASESEQVQNENDENEKEKDQSHRDNLELARCASTASLLQLGCRISGLDSIVTREQRDLAWSACVQWLEETQRTNVEAVWALSNLYVSGEAPCLALNRNKGLALLMTASLEGYAQTKCTLASRYSGLPTGFSWAAMAASRGSSLASMIFGALLQNGLVGLGRDQVAAEYYFRMGAQDRHYASYYENFYCANALGLKEVIRFRREGLVLPKAPRRKKRRTGS